MANEGREGGREGDWDGQTKVDKDWENERIELSDNQ